MSGFRGIVRRPVAPLYVVDVCLHLVYGAPLHCKRPLPTTARFEIKYDMGAHEYPRMEMNRDQDVHRMAAEEALQVRNTVSSC